MLISHILVYLSMHSRGPCTLVMSALTPPGSNFCPLKNTWLVLQLFSFGDNQYWENDYTTQSNLQIQCNLYQITNGIFLRTRTKYFTLYMETQKTPNSQRNLKKQRQGWRNQPSWLQTILQSYYNQDSIVLAQKQKYRSKKQDRKPRDRPLHLRAPYLWQKRQEHAMEKRQPLQ